MPNNHDMNRGELLAKGYREYPGGNLAVYFHKDICQHAAKCVHGDGKVFNLDQRPWIQPDEAPAERVAEIVDSCPSGALKYIYKDENES